MFFHFLLLVVWGASLRLLLFFLTWLAAPSFLFIFFSWLLLKDADFNLWIASNKPNVSAIESAYFKDRVCWITGASSGIGRSLAVLLAQRGALVILSGRDDLRLEKIAEECSRAYLVHSIRTCSRSDSTIDKIVSETTAPTGSRVLLIAFDLDNAEEVQAAVKRALQWQGRVDALFNNAGISERAILPDFSVDETIFASNCMNHMRLTKALIPSALRPAKNFKANKAPIIIPSLSQFSSKDFSGMARGVGTLVRSASLAGIQRTGDVIERSWVGKLTRRWIWGDSVEYNRTFHIVNTSSILARIISPGRAAYGAAKNALSSFCDVLEMETRAAAEQDEHKTEVIVTNCLPGQVSTPLLKNTILMDGKPAGDESERLWHTGNPISADRCAELIVRAATFRLPEVWIAKQPEITYVYASYYMPWLWKYFSRRFLEVPAFEAIQAYHEECRK